MNKKVKSNQQQYQDTFLKISSINNFKCFTAGARIILSMLFYVLIHKHEKFQLNTR